MRSPVTPALGVIVVSLVMSGCVTKSAMMIGSVREVLTGFREVQLSGSALPVRYQTKAWYFGSLPWPALDRLQLVPPVHNLQLECSMVHSTPEPA
jgi:hypothetical protein